MDYKDVNYKAIGFRLKVARTKRGLSQKQISEASGLSISHISNIETGNTKVSLPTIIRLANVIGCTSDDLLCDSIAFVRRPYQNDIVELLELCDNDVLRVVSDITQTLLISIRVNLKKDRDKDSRWNNYGISYYDSERES